MKLLHLFLNPYFNPPGSGTDPRGAGATTPPPGRGQRAARGGPHTPRVGGWVTGPLRLGRVGDGRVRGVRAHGPFRLLSDKPRGGGRVPGAALQQLGEGAPQPSSEKATTPLREAPTRTVKWFLNINYCVLRRFRLTGEPTRPKPQPLLNRSKSVHRVTHPTPESRRQITRAPALVTDITQQTSCELCFSQLSSLSKLLN